MQDAKTIGNVPRGPANRYWRFTLTPGATGVRAVLAKVVWALCTGLILVYSTGLYCWVTAKYKRKNGQSSEAIRSSIQSFINIYPTSVYPLVVKASELSFFQANLSEPSLELGTGDGYFTNELYAKIKRDKIIEGKLTFASDLIGHTLVQSDKYHFWRERIIADATQIPLPDSCLSTVIMNNLIHHLPDRQHAINEVHRVLKRNGLFLVTDELSGWATSQWHIKIRKLLSEKAYKDNLDNFLRKSVQCLLENDKFYRRLSANGDWYVCFITPFFSNKAMLLSSILETLNRKLGSPTPKPIRDILESVPLLRKAQVGMTKRIAEAFAEHDVEMIKESGATSIFVALVKKTKTTSVNQANLVCPVCKQPMLEQLDGKYCVPCKKLYPLFDNRIPVLIPYFDRVPEELVTGDIKNVKVPEVSC